MSNIILPISTIFEAIKVGALIGMIVTLAIEAISYLFKE